MVNLPSVLEGRKTPVPVTLMPAGMPGQFPGAVKSKSVIGVGKVLMLAMVYFFKMCMDAIA
jgi:hypothetical protein